MTSPRHVVEVNFADLGSEPAWVDWSDQVKSFTIARGRNSERDQIEPGHATVVFNDPNRDLDPLNSAGAHAPDVRPMRGLRISAEIDTSILPFRMRSSRMRSGAALRAGTTLVPLYTGFIKIGRASL